MAKNEKLIQDNEVFNNDSEGKGEPQKDTLGRKIKRMFVSLLVIIGIGAVAYVAVDDSMKEHFFISKSAPVKKSHTEDAYEKRIADLEKKVKNLQSVIQYEQKAENVSGNEVEQKINQLKQELLKVIGESKGSPEQVQIVSVPREAQLSQEMQLATGAIVVRDLAEKGLPFAYEAEVLQILAEGNVTAADYIKTIQQYAVSGVKGESVLISAFNRFYDSLDEQQQIVKEKQQNIANNSKSWDEKFLFWLKSLFVRKKKESVVIFDNSKDRVYELVNSGHLAEALELMKTDVKYSKLNSSVLAEWKVQVQNYLNFETAISGLIMNSLARLHLKEMEH